LARYKLGKTHKARFDQPEVLFREKRYEAAIEALEGLEKIARGNTIRCTLVGSE
jgi:hypothetical protein